MLAVDRTGRVRDGDEIDRARGAPTCSAGGALLGGVAVTVMTNYGFHAAMADAGIEVATTQVGDRYVIEELRERDWALGGEQSGHVIWMDFAPTGDGIAAALLLETALGGRDLADAAPFERLPQRLVNVELTDRDALDGATGAVGGGRARGRRRSRAAAGCWCARPAPSRVVRLMVEAPSEGECDAVLARLTEVAERELG